MTKHPKKALLALLIPTLMCHTAQANTTEVSEPKVELEHETINISAKPKEQVGETIVTRRELNEQMVQNAQDLVRYNTEVDVAEVGRYGNKGFAIRGVDGNRVAMNIDGVALPEVESNELFSPYGYIYEGRFNPDLEMMGGVRIAAGADSLLSGSGAVGGSVSYRTKEPISMVKDGNLGGYAKVGYTTKNEEILTAVGLAGVYDKAEFLINYAHRKGHELKNHDMRKHNKDRESNIAYFDNPAVLSAEWGTPSRYQSSLYPDSATYERDAVLTKLYYHINDEHRIGASGLYQKQNSNSYAISKSVSGRRMSKDVEKLKGFGINYRYQPTDHHHLDTINTEYQYQDILGLADTWIYTPGNYVTPPSREYRPTTNKTHQFTLNTKFTPMDLGKFGEHRFDLTAIYRKQDYTSTAVNFINGHNPSTAAQATNFPFPDAKKDNISLILQDHIHLNDRFNAKLGLRYDHYKYAPYFQDDVFFGNLETSEQKLLNDNNTPYFLSRFKLYQDLRDGVYNQKPTFDKITYNGSFDYKIIPDHLSVRYKFGTGFLAPTITQMYSALDMMGVQQLVNPKLKPETSFNHELEFEIKYNPITLNASWYHSDYKNFIQSIYWKNGAYPKYDTKDCRLSNDTCIQSHNLDEAEITGVKLGVKLDISELLNLDNRLLFSVDYHKSHDEARVSTLNNGTLTINTLASPPSSTILGVDYHFLDDKASLHARAKFTENKRPEDTKYAGTVRDSSYPSGYREEVKTYDHLWRGKDTWVFDVFGSYKMADRLTLQAGVYNLTDSKYIPWENLRQFGNNPSINSMVDLARGGAGHGFNRYTAPGRNYALSLTYEF